MFNLSKKFKIGIIGCGNIMETLHLPVLLNIDNVEIKFLYDKDYHKSQKLSRLSGVRYYSSVKEILSDNVDIFLIAIPYGARDEWYELISENYKNQFLFVEKPVILSQKNIENFKQKNLFNRIFSGFMRRYYSNTNILKKFIQGYGENKVKKIIISEGNKITATSFNASNYRVSKTLAGGGILAETACHLFDQLDYLFPNYNHRIDKCSIVYEGDLDVHAEAQFYLKNGNFEIPVEAKFSNLENLENEIKIFFDGFILKSGITPKDDVQIIFNNRFKLSINAIPEYAKTSYQAFYLEWRDVLKSVSENKEAGVSLSKTLNAGLLIESLYKFSIK